MAARNVSYAGRKDLLQIKEFMGIQVFMCQGDGKFVFERPDKQYDHWNSSGVWISRPTLSALEKEITGCMASIKAINYNNAANINIWHILKPEKSSSYSGQRWRLKNGRLTSAYEGRNLYVFDQALYDEALALKAEVDTFTAERNKFFADIEQRSAVIIAKMTPLTAANFKEQSEKASDIEVEFGEGDLLA